MPKVTSWHTAKTLKPFFLICECTLSNFLAAKGLIWMGRSRIGVLIKRSWSRGYDHEDLLARSLGLLHSSSKETQLFVIISKGDHLAKCHLMALGQVPFTKIRNLAQFAHSSWWGHLARWLTVTCSSAAIHLAKCTDWSLIQVTSRTDHPFL